MLRGGGVLGTLLKVKGWEEWSLVLLLTVWLGGGVLLTEGVGGDRLLTVEAGGGKV